MSNLTALRAEIDSIDENIIKLIVQRQAAVKKIALYKAGADIQARQPVRHREVLQKRQAMAAKQGLNPALAGAVWQLLMTEAIRIQEEVLLDANK